LVKTEQKDAGVSKKERPRDTSSEIVVATGRTDHSAQFSSDYCECEIIHLLNYTNNQLFKVKLLYYDELKVTLLEQYQSYNTVLQ